VTFTGRFPNLARRFSSGLRHQSVYSFRRRIPDDLRALGLPIQLVRSLRTSDRREAVVLARRLAAETDTIFLQLRSMSKTGGELKVGWTMSVNLAISANRGVAN
jgi:hypothetical protein